LNFAKLSKKDISPPYELIWTLVGVLLTIGSTFIKVFLLNAPWEWLTEGIKLHFLGMSYQVGAVLLTGCLGGKKAGALSQIAYLFIGLTLLPVFAQGGGLNYYQQPSFGYLLGFILGAYICGYLAFLAKPTLERLAISCLCGLAGVHFCGILYLIVFALITSANNALNQFWLWFQQYSLVVLPGQLTIVCTITIIAYLLRLILFY
jgi:biotin transport system substrate-specific component